MLRGTFSQQNKENGKRKMSDSLKQLRESLDTTLHAQIEANSKKLLVLQSHIDKLVPETDKLSDELRDIERSVRKAPSRARLTGEHYDSEGEKKEQQEGEEQVEEEEQEVADMMSGSDIASTIDIINSSFLEKQAKDMASADKWNHAVRGTAYGGNWDMDKKKAECSLLSRYFGFLPFSSSSSSSSSRTDVPRVHSSPPVSSSSSSSNLSPFSSPKTPRMRLADQFNSVAASCHAKLRFVNNPFRRVSRPARAVSLVAAVLVAYWQRRRFTKHAVLRVFRRLPFILSFLGLMYAMHVIIGTHSGNPVGRTLHRASSSFVDWGMTLVTPRVVKKIRGDTSSPALARRVSRRSGKVPQLSISSKLVSPNTLAMPPPSLAITKKILVTKDHKTTTSSSQQLRQMR